MSPPRRVSAMVLNYNGRRLLETLLPSLAAQTYGDLEVVVVDDCSSDDSAAYVAEHWPQYGLLATGEQNVGVAAAFNVAVAAARGELVALLNNDLALEPDWLAELVAAIDRHPDAAAVTGKTLNYWRRGELDGAGDVFTLAATAHRRGIGAADHGQFDAEEEVFAASAGAALYRASALADVGGFDESFIAYLEDVDWGLRARLAGYRAWYAPRAVAYHMGGGTTGGERSDRYYGLLRRNTIAVAVKDVPLLFLLRHLPHVVWHHAASLGRSARGGRLRVHLRAWASVVPLLPRWLAERRRIMRARRISLRDFDRLATRRPRPWRSRA
jgi:GT2 family glycosyltransferase